MKIRSGFVSNSSSSSFLIWGVCLREDNELSEKIWDNVKAISSLGIDYHMPAYSGIFLGACPSSMKDEQTLAEWKKDVENHVNQVLDILEEHPDKIKFSWHEYAWRDG